MAQYRITVGLALLLVLICSGAGRLDAWVSARSKKSPDRISYKTPFKPRWVSRLKKGAFYKYKRREYAGPAADDEAVYVGVESGYFYAFRLHDGSKLWRVEVDGPVSSVPAVGFGKVFFGDDNGVFYALDKTSGEEVWRLKTESPIMSMPVLDNNRLYVVTLDGTLMAIDASNGSRIWTVPYRSRVSAMSLYGHSPPLLVDGIIYIGYSDGELVAYRASDGGKLWDRNLSGGKTKLVDINMQVLLSGDDLYVATFAGDLYRLKRQDGSTVWQAPVGSAVRFASAQERLFVSGADGAVYAIDADDGKMLWKYQTPKGALSTPVLYGELLAVASTEESIIFIDSLNGNVVAHRFARKNVSSDPILGGDEGNLLVYLSNGGRLYALELKKDFRVIKEPKKRRETAIPDDRPEYNP